MKTYMYTATLILHCYAQNCSSRKQFFSDNHTEILYKLLRYKNSKPCTEWSVFVIVMFY